LYQNPKNKTEVPESPPQQPLSKASPPMKRAKFQTLPPQQPQQQQQQQQQQTTQILQQSPAVLPSKVAPISNHHIPVKVCNLASSLPFQDILIPFFALLAGL